MNKSCPLQAADNAELLLAYCDRKLEPKAMLEFEHHLSQCESCREVLAAQQSVWNALDAWEPEEISTVFDSALLARIENEARQPWWRRLAVLPLPWNWKPAMPLAAACLLVAAGVLLRPPTPAEPAADTAETEQIERALEDMEMLDQLGIKTS